MSSSGDGNGTRRVFDQRPGARIRRYAARDPLLRGGGPARAAPRWPATHLYAARPHAPQAHAARQAPRAHVVRDPRADRHVRAGARRAAAARALPRGARVAQGEPAAAAGGHRGAAFGDQGIRKKSPSPAQALAALEYPFPEVPAPGATVDVAPGIRWLSMPLPFKLDHINLWLAADGDGWAIIDTGIGNGDTRALWAQILVQKKISKVVVTHYHPDHAGNAAWLCQRYGTELWMTQGE